jgi:outer membrane protein OmpA-like peptidoglycan-associated protein
VLGHDAGIHVPFSDTFHTLKGIIPIAVELDKRRLVIPVDFFWVKLGDDRGIPFNELGQTSVNIHLTESIFTPKIGYRLVNAEHFKFDALAGIRYWYVGQNLTVDPVGIGRSRSASWVDGLGGVRAILPLSEKASITVSGDAGAGGANLDYQALGLLNYNFTRKWGASVGWRYLYVNYRPTNDLFVFNTAMTGAVAGFSYNFGGKPAVPPTASCSVSPTEVYPDDPVTATMNAQNFNPKHTVTYNWTSNGGKISGTNTTASVDTAGLTAGSYAVSGTATDEKEKRNNVATCNANFTVKARPMNPPQVSCSVNPSTVQGGSPSTITAMATSPDNAQITGYTYSSSAGRISGTGTTATLDTAGAGAGPVTVTVTATDARNLSGTGTCSVNVEVPPPPPTCSKANSIQFPDLKRPWRVDNTAKAILDDVASRLKSDPNAKIVIIGYADGEKAPMEGSGKNRHPMNLAAQRAVNAKAYLVQQQGIDPSRVEVRQGTGQQKVADIIWVPQGADENACADLQNTTPVDESVVKPSENAYPKAATVLPRAHHGASAPAQ